jgi:hypothetical protein
MVRTTLCVLAMSCCRVLSILAAPTAESIEFFEKRIRPILVQDCYECHRSGVSEKGGLALDHREAVLKGGRSGKVIVPGDPEASLLIKAIRHEMDQLTMPKAGARLESSVIADFEKWIRMGAPDPRDRPASDTEIAADNSWDALLRRRASWWSFRPIEKFKIPISDGTSQHPIDLFVRAKLREVGLTPASKAEPRTLVRRLSYVLRGLPPTPEELKEFDHNSSNVTCEKWIDSLLASPRFGEHWARHWMDWVRYADSHGSEGDPMIPYAWRYRDYLIRALNEDVPYDQLLREHLAGDLLAEPRIDRELGINESALGIGHFRMVLHGFAPTDALEERVRNIDDQIDVISKAFLGLTVSCARCHNHKFDAISQKDFYAMYGILAATTPASIGVGAQSSETKPKRAELASIKSKIKPAISDAWLKGADGLAARLVKPAEKLRISISSAKDKRSILHLLFLAEKHNRNVRAAVAEWNPQVKGVSNAVELVKRWSFERGSDETDWIRNGTIEFSPAGGFVVAQDGDRVLDTILPAGMYTHLATSRDRGVFLSPRFKLDHDYNLWLRVAGDGGAVARYVIQNYPRDGSIYPVTRLNGGDWRWIKYPLNYWTGDRMHVELSTAADQAVLADTEAIRSWFGITDVLITRRGEDRPDDRGELNDFLTKVLQELELKNFEDLANGYARALHQALLAWQTDQIDDSQVHFLNQALQLGLVDNSLASASAIKPFVIAYRDLERSLPEPVRAPGLIETAVEEQPLLVRGDHKHPGEIVPRRFLEAFRSTPYQTARSGRSELADDFLGAGRPLSSRVIVNRVWQHMFGRGLVGTPDNFGRLGEPPSHPELLDFLADWFGQNGYSIKKLIRLIATSETWQASSRPPAGASESDPENKFLSHANLRRLEAEAIRDSLFAVSGSLSDEMYGPSVPGTASRRSVYLRVKRNDLDLLLSTFDAPVPSGTKGRREVTNVPGQSLAFLNDTLILELAERWGTRLEHESASRERTEQIEAMFLDALGRRPVSSELQASQRLLDVMKKEKESLSVQHRSLEKELLSKTEQLAAVRSAGRSRVELHRAEVTVNHPRSVPQPAGDWDFSRGLKDQVGNLDSRVFGNARIEDGALLVDGKSSYLATEALNVSLREKTLEAWVQLETLDQQGGGVITVQDLGGEIFDSIVFGEQQTGHWMAGSEFFNRTKDFSGPTETEAEKTPVHIAVTYLSDGTITLYRNGNSYGRSYRSKGPVEFLAGKSQVLFGNRHGTPGSNRNLAGKIFRARLYPRALRPDEIQDLARDHTGIVTDQDLVAALDETERWEYEALEMARTQIQERLKKIDSEKGLLSPWANLAHALFNLKEFIYVQ